MGGWYQAVGNWKIVFDEFKLLDIITFIAWPISCTTFESQNAKLQKLILCGVMHFKIGKGVSGFAAKGEKMQCYSWHRLLAKKQTKFSNPLGSVPLFNCKLQKTAPR